jgi:copper transport protein
MRWAARGLLAALMWLCVVPAVAGAHATVVRTTPADKSVVGPSLRTVSIRWSEPVDLGPDSVRLLDASGAQVEVSRAERVRGDRSTAVFRLPPGLAEGTYVVAWRVTSADSHPVSGAFSFSLGQPSALVAAGEPAAASALVKVLDGIARGLSFVGFALTVGGALVALFLWPEGRASVRARRFLQVGLGALMTGSVALLLLQGPYATGGGALDAFSPALLEFSLSTRFGQALVVRILLTLALAALIARELRPPASGGAPGLAAAASGGAALRRPAALGLGACVVGLLLTWTLTDHSRTGVQTWLGVPAASVHLLAMTLWLGGLTLLLACVLRRPPASLEPVVPRFSRLALGCFVVLGLTGAYLAWRQAGELAALPATTFGRLLLVKSGIVVVVLVLAWFSRRAVARRGGDLARRLRRTVLAEAVLGVVVLGVTAGLVNAAPARVAYVRPVDVTVAGVNGGQVQVHVEPAKQGPNVVDIYLVNPGGRLFIPAEIEARLRGGDSPPLPVELTSAEPGHYVATAMTVPAPGDWTLRLTVRTSEIDEQAIDVPVRIR